MGRITTTRLTEAQSVNDAGIVRAAAVRHKRRLAREKRAVNPFGRGRGEKWYSCSVAKEKAAHRAAASCC